MPRIYRSPSGNPDRKYPPRRYVPGTGLPDIPPAVLQRHGGRALRPGDTAMIVDVSSTPSVVAETVSWSDVSWSDGFLTE